jgi:hypothetical protein
MKWKKLGRIFCADHNHPWMLTHAANPVAEHLESDLFRIYFNARDESKRASIATVDIALRDPTRVLAVSSQPVLGPGAVGLFDDSGVSMGCLVSQGPRRLLYYLGWNLGVTVPWRNSIGLAISEGPGQPFERFSPAPLLDRCDADPYTLSYPWVMEDDGLWRLWYGSSLGWGAEQKDMAHLIKYAESSDGIRWRREGRVALPFRSPDEYAMSKPCVRRDGDLYRMWYCYRGDRYRIGYAESRDGVEWVRRDELAGIDISDEGWDSQMVCYPFVFDHGGNRYMLYNGNGYGATGFGLAILERNSTA